MESESARMSSAAEARFRVDYPNSRPRAVKVVALDHASEHLVKRAAERTWQGATFFTSLTFEGSPRRGGDWSIPAWLSDLAGRTKTLVEEVASADLVVMVSSAGTTAQAAAVIGVDHDVWGAERVELPRWACEQSLSRTRHRHGRLDPGR